MEDDWFAAAADAAASSSRARDIRAAQEKRRAEMDKIVAATTKMTAATTASVAEVEEALKAFGAAAKSTTGLGIGPAYVPKYTPSPRPGSRTLSAKNPDPPTRVTSAEAGLAAIVAEIKKSDDPFTTSGYWLTRVTNAIAEARREVETEE